MATYQAVAAVCEGVIQLLRSNYRPEAFNLTELDFKVYTTQDFASPMNAGVSLFLYRVQLFGTHRAPAGRVGLDGRRQKTQLPLELHFLLTAWGKDSSLQNTIAGWMMRTLEDAPTLPAPLLNSIWASVFRADETVDVVPGELSTEDLMRIWELLSEHRYQLSVPYTARVVSIESDQTVAEADLVRQRHLVLGRHEREAEPGRGP